MEWIQVLTIVATLFGGLFYIHQDIKDLKANLQQQNARVDKLYEMFIDLLHRKR